MKKNIQILIKQDPKIYNYLKDNSNYIKDFNRNSITIDNFKKIMKEKYQERTSDKLLKVVDNIDIISSVLDIFK